MSLKAFHLFFIAAAILMSLVVGGWGVNEYLHGGGAGLLTLGVLCFLLGAVLVVYGLKVYRKLQALGES